MKPFPSEISLPTRQPVLHTAGTMRYENRITPRVPKIYPVLLVFSTLVAAGFCWLYLNKPVIETTTVVQTPAPHTPPAPAVIPPSTPSKPAVAPPKAEAPSLAEVPKPITPPVLKLDSKVESTLPRQLPTSATSPFEESNLRVQHVFTASTPTGELGRVILDVPVLYQSRNLRWSPQDVKEARLLLSRLNAYQEKVRELRGEGSALMESWNALIARSMPANVLRADSPSLPENQRATAKTGASQNSVDALRTQPASR